MGIREEQERLDRAALMPHRSIAGDNRLDARLESKLGRLYFDGLIPQGEYEAGLRYGNIVLMYLSSTDAPEPYGGKYLDDIEDDACLRRKIDMSAVKAILKPLGRKCGCIVDRICVYDQDVNESDIFLLRRALQILAGGI